MLLSSAEVTVSEMNRLNFILLDKTDVDKVFLQGHNLNLQLKKGNDSQYMLSQYSAYRKMFKIAIISNRDLSIVIIAYRGASGDSHP